jgi:8-oxo-dGTP diphosphatase
MVSSQPPDRPLIGVGVIVMRDDRVLLGRRKNSHGAGTWQFPGGHLEWHESIEGCARREVLEETGLQIANLRRGPYTNDIFPEEGKHYVTLYVLADGDGGEPVVREPDRCDRWGWFPWHDLPAPRFIPLANLLAQGFDPFWNRHRGGCIQFP